jgi:hypothetical protein
MDPAVGINAGIRSLAVPALPRLAQLANDAPAKSQHASHENGALDNGDPGPHLREII